MRDEDFRQLSAHYLAELKSLGPPLCRVTDKTPENLILEDLIHLIRDPYHTRRNPIDTCVSCFRQGFRGKQSQHHDLTELGRCYRITNH